MAKTIYLSSNAKDDEREARDYYLETRFSHPFQREMFDALYAYIDRSNQNRYGLHRNRRLPSGYEPPKPGHLAYDYYPEMLRECRANPFSRSDKRPLEHVEWTAAVCDDMARWKEKRGIDDPVPGEWMLLHASANVPDDPRLNAMERAHVDYIRHCHEAAVERGCYQSFAWTAPPTSALGAMYQTHVENINALNDRFVEALIASGVDPGTRQAMNLNYLMIRDIHGESLSAEARAAGIPGLSPEARAVYESGMARFEEDLRFNRNRNFHINSAIAALNAWRKHYRDAYVALGNREPLDDRIRPKFLQRLFTPPASDDPQLSPAENKALRAQKEFLHYILSKENYESSYHEAPPCTPWRQRMETQAVANEMKQDSGWQTVSPS